MLRTPTAEAVPPSTTQPSKNDRTMGYAVLHLDKAPGNEAAMTAHIARTKIPTNASPERTCLNEELVEFPEEVADRTEAINYRLEHAGLTRKIGTNQVRVIRVMLTGSHDAMKRIEEEGRLPEWCADNLAWLRETFGAENVVSAVVHRDESTPHIHAAVVPIVTGERRKARTAASETPGKRHYRTKSAARPRLCADDVMSRVRLKQYQDSYAAAMSKYGLERGIDGSEARHVTTQEFYRQAIAQQQDLQENIDALLRLEEQKRKAVEQLKQQERQVRTEYEQTASLQAQKSAELNRTEAELKSVKGELKGARLKNAAAEVGSNIVEGIGAMIGTSRIKRQQQEIDRLSDENAQMDEQLAAVGASPVGDYMANAGVAAEDAAQNVVAAGVQELMTEEELPEIAMPEGLDDIDNQWEDEDFEELDAEVPQENAASLAEHTAEQTKPEALAEADDTMEAGTSAEDVEAAILAETARQMAKESVEKEELPEIELPGDLDLGKEETAEEILPAIAEPEAFEVPDTISKLSKELREIFTYFVPITGMEEQLCQALTGASQHLTKGATAGTGNMIIQGGSGSGKTVLATSMIKALQKETGKPNGKIGKIEASVLNQKDVAALLKKVAGGCLIIEKAGDLSRETALKLSLLLEQDTSGVLVIIEDTKHGIQKALSRDDGFAAKFSEKINIPIFTSDELVSFAKSYANELGYTIDEMGVLALYNSISNIEHADRETTLTEVKEIVDKAVAHSEKGGLKKAFSIITSRRYDEDDYIILREKDFD